RREDGIPVARSRTPNWCLAGWSRSTLRECVVDREPPRPCQSESDGRGHEGEHEFVACRQEESGRQVHEEQGSEHRACENDAYGTCEEPEYQHYAAHELDQRYGRRQQGGHGNACLTEAFGNG